MPPARSLALWLALLVHLPADGRPAADYLSDEYFPGLHILERQGDEGGSFRLYPQGQRPTDDEAKLEVSTAGWKSMKEARTALEQALSIPPREPYQPDWGIFDQQGQRLVTLDALRGVAVAFIIELGQWMWPAVRVGFEHVAEGVAGDAPKKLRTLSLRPVVFEVQDFIQPEECDEVQRLGKSQGLVASKGMLQSSDIAKGTADADFRTSKQTWLHGTASPVVDALDERTANLTRVPRSHNEPVQVLRYDEGNYYHGHMDWAELELYPDQKAMWLRTHYGHQDRLATVFWYLNDVAEGGETIFPKHGQVICPTYQQRVCKGARDPDMASCAKGLKVPPRRGTVVLWYNYHPSGRGDRNALHAGCPVGKGLVKWSGNKWVNIKPFGSPYAKWMDDHPALRRYQWRDAGARREATKGCSVSFRNTGSESIDVLWMGDPGDPAKVVATVPPGSQTSLTTSRGQRFKIHRENEDGDSETSNQVKVNCRASGENFVATKDFRLARVKAQEEL